MTRRQLARCTGVVTIAYLSVIAVAFVLHARSPALYLVLRDFIPVIVAAPAAWLAWAFQRRLSYLHALRMVWSDAIASVQGALRYTETRSPSRQLHTRTLSDLVATIEQVRGLFKNVEERDGAGGMYSFEQLKVIHGAVLDLGHGAQASAARRREARLQIIESWKQVRARLLLEFDRATPTYRSDILTVPHALDVAPALRASEAH
jgi:hypothetical protein